MDQTGSKRVWSGWVMGQLDPFAALHIYYQASLCLARLGSLQGEWEELNGSERRGE